MRKRILKCFDVFFSPECLKNLILYWFLFFSIAISKWLKFWALTLIIRTIPKSVSLFLHGTCYCLDHSFFLLLWYWYHSKWFPISLLFFFLEWSLFICYDTTSTIGFQIYSGNGLTLPCTLFLVCKHNKKKLYTFCLTM